jgi:sRNA-binding protein
MKRTIAKAQLKLWVALFPNTFFDWSIDPVPLKVGIRRDLFAEFPECDPRHISTTLRAYTSTRKYQNLLCEAGRDRVDLRGLACGKVTPDQAAVAKQRLIERRHRDVRDGVVTPGARLEMDYQGGAVQVQPRS